MGALDENSLTNKYFIASHTYYHDILTWCVKKKQAMPIWKNIFYLCTDSMVWILYTIMCFTVIFTAYFLQQFENVQPKWDWFRITVNGLSVICGYGSVYKPQILSNRIFYTLALFSSMIFGVTMIAFFIKFLSEPIYLKQISFVQELMDESFDLAGDIFALQHLKMQNDEYPTELLERFKSCSDLDACLSQLQINSKLAVAISREHSLNSHLISPSQIYCFEKSEIIYEYALKFLIRKEFAYIEELNEFIRQASAGGLIEKWHKDSQFQHNYIHRPRTYFRLSMDNFYGTHLILLGLALAAIFIFLLELFVYKKVTKPNPSKFWMTVEFVIDPVRYFWLENRWV